MQQQNSLLNRQKQQSTVVLTLLARKCNGQEHPLPTGSPLDMSLPANQEIKSNYDLSSWAKTSQPRGTNHLLYNLFKELLLKEVFFGTQVSRRGGKLIVLQKFVTLT